MNLNNIIDGDIPLEELPEALSLLAKELKIQKSHTKPDKIFTQKEAADYLSISTTTLVRLEKSNNLKSIRTPGQNPKYLKQDLDKYISNLKK